MINFKISDSDSISLRLSLKIFQDASSAVCQIHIMAMKLFQHIQEVGEKNPAAFEYFRKFQILI